VKKGGGIVLLGLAFTAGVATAQLLGNPPAGCAALSLSCAVILAGCAFLKGPCRPLLMLLFFCLGALCSCTEALVGAPAPQNPFSPALDALAAAIDRTDFPGEHSGAIITALLTGRRGGLPRPTVEAFRRSGASHILALSGLHLGVIYLFIRRLFAPAGNTPAARFARAGTCISLCAFYTLITGAGPSTVRAFLFILINEVGRALSGRRSAPLSTFSTALMIQLAVRPSLINSVGFQLSYLAMLGIILLFPNLNSWFPEGRSLTRRIWSAAAMSTSCQLFTAPVAWWHFRSLPKYYLITNLIALPMTEVIIVTALVCLILGALGICPPILVRFCGHLVELMEFCLEAISSL